MITEDQLEQLCLDWFKSIGYNYICGYDIAPDGDSLDNTDYYQINQPDGLNQQLKKLNTDIKDMVLAC